MAFSQLHFIANTSNGLNAIRIRKGSLHNGNSHPAEPGKQIYGEGGKINAEKYNGLTYDPKEICDIKNKIFMDVFNEYSDKIAADIAGFCKEKYGLRIPPDFKLDLNCTNVSRIFTGGPDLFFSESFMKKLIIKPTGLSKIGPFIRTKKMLTYARRLQAKKILTGQDQKARQCRELFQHIKEEIVLELLNEFSFQNVKDMLTPCILQILRNN